MAAIAKIEFCSSNKEFFNVTNSNDMCIHFKNPLSNIFIGNSNTNTFVKIGNNSVTAGECLIVNNNIIMNSNTNTISTKSGTDLKLDSRKIGIGMTPLYDMDINKNVRINGSLYFNSTPFSDSNSNNDYQFIIHSVKDSHIDASSAVVNEWLRFQSHGGKTTFGLSNDPTSTLEVLQNMRIVDDSMVSDYLDIEVFPGMYYSGITTNTSNNYMLLQSNRGKTGICLNREPFETVEIGGKLRISSSSNDSNYCIISHNDISFGGPLVIQKDGGFIGLGVDPLVDLHAKGDLRIENRYNSNVYVDLTTNDQSVSLSQWSSNMSVRIGIEGSKVGIGMGENETPESTLHVKGTLYVTNGTISTSDDRLKTGEEFISNAMQTINKLRPQTYYKGGRKESGLIAQEVFYDAPELRHIVQLPSDADKTLLENSYIASSYDPKMDPLYDKWGEKPAGIQYDGLIAYLIKGMQEKDYHIRMLEERVSRLEKK